MARPDGEPKPVEDVLDQQRDDAPEEYDDRGTTPLPAEADEADHADQHIAVPVEDDRYPDG